MSTEQQKIDSIIASIKHKQSLPKLDRIQAEELVLFSMNDYPSYQRIMAWKENYGKKLSKGRYDYNLAIKGLALNLVPDLAKNYKKEVGGLGTLSLETKVYAAIDLEEEIQRLIREE